MAVESQGAGMALAFWDGCNGLGFILIFLVDLLGITASNMEPIYWNTLNKRFQDDRGYVLYPQIGDRLDLICPASNPQGPRSPSEYEYYKLYLVSTREQADRCEVMGAPNLLLTCDKPNSDMRFTIKFQEFSPNLWGHEFKTLQDYYIIGTRDRLADCATCTRQAATSDGTRQGLDSMRGGVCVTRGMKVILKVGQTAYGLPPKPKPDPNRFNPKGNGTTPKVGGEGEGNNGNNPPPSSSVAVIAGAVGGGVFLLIVTAVICVVCYRWRQNKHSETHHPTLTLTTLTPKRGSTSGAGCSAGGNNGSEPSDIIIPLRTSDSAYCPHYEKVSGDYGHPVYIVQEMPPQSPANIYYKV
ncbi:ephrin-B2-like isoform X1 [Salmo trutta]|uniref:ephrin-B2-like isoform X1 n=1 Tax=Salmo trutta TaxID=8032 RepID=UPI0011320008|nr:ephrin-B2-like isoform X1 [Salmo trutta]